MKRTFVRDVIGFGFFLVPAIYHPYYNDQYTAAKWGAVYLLCFLGLVVALFSKDEIKLPQTKTLLLAIAALIGLTGISISLNWPGAYENQYLDWICFFSITILSFQLFAYESEMFATIVRYNSAATILVILYGILQSLHIDPFPILQKNEFPSSFFGFQNMTAEFIALSIILQIFSVYLKQSRSKGKKSPQILFDLVLLASSVIYISVLQCRSAFVGLLAATLPLALFPWKGRLRWVPLTTAVLALCMLLPSLHNRTPASAQPKVQSTSTTSSNSASPTSSQLTAIKSSNVSLRLIRWKNTISMILAHPFGVGPGNYEFEYIPFSNQHGKDFEVAEENLVKSPHNGYLQAAAQNGVLFLLILVITLGLLCIYFYQRYSSYPKERGVALLLVSILLFVLVDALFAFPMENAYPFFLVAVFSGLALRLGKPTLYKFKKQMKPAFLLPLIAIVGYFGFFFHASKTIEVLASDNYRKVAFACDHFPSNWRVCLRKAELELESQRYKEAELSSRILLAKSSYNFLALHLLSIALANEGNYEESCRYLKSYDAIFQNRSSLHSVYLDNCAPS